MDGYVVKFKRVDNQKYWIGGNVKQGKYGLQIGMKKSPELKAYLDSIEDGGWINLSLDAPYDQREQKEPRSAAAKSVVTEDDGSEIPF